MGRIAVVILNFNGLAYLRKFLPGVVEHSSLPGTEVVVADNASADGSVAYVKENHPGVRLIEMDRNHGFAGGYDRVLRQLSASYAVLLNSDVEVTSGWLQPLLAAMESDSRLAACMPRIRSFHNRTYFEYAGASGGFIDSFGYPFCRGRILSELEEDKGQYDRQVSVFWATGACMFVRMSAYLQSGGLDGDFFAHMEEIDLCWRFHRMDYRVAVIPASVVYHVGGGTLPNNNPHKLFLNYRNSLYLLAKNLPAMRLIPILFIRLLLDGLSAVIYLLKGSSPFFLAVLRAHLAFYGKLPALMAKRTQPPEIEMKRNINEMYPGSIIADYFIRGRKHFSDLQW